MRQIAAISYLICLAPMAGAKVMNLPLDKVVKMSDLVGVGTVTAIRVENGIRLATVQFETVLKGRAESADFVAEPTWACDGSGANLGERGIYMLQRRMAGDNIFRKGNREARTLAKPAYVITHAGHGRLLLTGRAPRELHSWKVFGEEKRASHGLIYPKELKISVRGQRVSAQASNLLALVRRYAAPAKVA